MIKRELYMKQVRPFIGKGIVKVLAGIRRCGKSVMLKLIQEELKETGISESQFISINFESKALDFIKHQEDTYAYIKEFARGHSGKIYLFLDEVQVLDKWEELVNACMIDFDCDIYITGSNAKLLSGELATYLAGRYIQIQMYPFSFQEVMLSSPDADKKKLFQEYLRWGGMPFLYQYPMDETAKRQYLSDIYDSIMLKDVVTRNHIRDTEQFERILYYLIANTGNTFSAGNISKYMKSEFRNISNETMYNYIDYCQKACLLHLVSRMDLQGKNLLKFQEKIYLTDHGIREALYGNNQRDIEHILENIVYMELLRRGYQVTIGKMKELEVDFVGEKDGRKEYYQVCYLLASQETTEKEFRSLREIQDNYPKYVISMDELDFSQDGYQHLNLLDFLLT